MSIERDNEIIFHEEGTLNAVTRWISSHDEGIAEWLKNARRAYQPDRGNVADGDRVAVVLLKDADKSSAARIGLLDEGARHSKTLRLGAYGKIRKRLRAARPC